MFVPPHQRQIGYVFQEASLFAHLNVRDNLNFGRRRVEPSNRKVKFNTICDLLGLTQLLDRPPDSLSGGERQRVAIARALLTSPKLLLMDEPLSALDHALKNEVLPYLEELHQALSIPIVYVSHSPNEVARLADYIAIIDQGRLVQNGTLAKVMLDPSAGNLFNEQRSCLFYTHATSYQDQYLTELITDTLTFWVPKMSVKENTKVRCQINARDVSICLTRPLDTSITNIFSGIITQIEKLNTPGECVVTLCVATRQYLLATISYASVKRLDLKIGDQVWAQIKSVVIL
ncbi:molybdenum ABC transporter ATP-binding protein [Psychromonas sp. KJ10-10]|uniref:molybdenum ABC transporter ATP-binding protein n=1 Tax=Psychromonas sp. KJ10-10 TaxID=3391823 RepID=UPI0039B53542